MATMAQNHDRAAELIPTVAVSAVDLEIKSHCRSVVDPRTSDLRTVQAPKASCPHGAWSSTTRLSSHSWQRGSDSPLLL
jgi:hypothetical protein